MEDNGSLDYKKMELEVQDFAIHVNLRWLIVGQMRRGLPHELVRP